MNEKGIDFESVTLILFKVLVVCLGGDCNGDRIENSVEENAETAIPLYSSPKKATPNVRT